MRYVGWIALLVCCLSVKASTPYTCLFYNVENYFDCVDDSLTQDDEFVPDKGKFWTPKRLTAKRENIARVIAAVGQGVAPVLVGLCEVENSEVLTQLVRYKPLSVWDYRYVHFDSPDARGIDVALLYQPNRFQPIQASPIGVAFADGAHSRDILYVKGLLAGVDTLHVMVCHAPSRRTGVVGDKRRMHAMRLLAQKVDSVLAVQPAAKVLVMGDFNDTPAQDAIAQTIGKKLCNLMDTAQGSYKYKGEWLLFDQFMASPALLTGAGFVVKNKQGYVYNAHFLLQPDETYMGYKPFRTYVGPRYLGGYSDHLPIYLQLVLGY